MSKASLDAQDIPQIVVGAFIEGAQQADAGLHAEDAALPAELCGRGFLHTDSSRSMHDQSTTVDPPGSDLCDLTLRFVRA